MAAQTFTRVVRPGAVADYDSRTVSVFCKISFDAGRLSITGVEGPLSSGNCIGGCGQIDSTLREVPADAWTFAEGWNTDLLARFLAVWDDWHLNDMRAYDAEMKAAGWPAIAQRAVFAYRFTLDDAAIKAKRTAEGLALDALKEGRPFIPLPEQTAAVSRPYEVTIYQDHDQAPPAAPEFYKPKENYTAAGSVVAGPERKTLGWLRPSEHPEGLLGRKLREDGPGYGSAWFREDVPADVLAFLQGLPVADRNPAWV
jgi:hypothetical protein